MAAAIQCPKKIVFGAVKSQKECDFRMMEVLGSQWIAGFYRNGKARQCILVIQDKA